MGELLRIGWDLAAGTAWGFSIALWVGVTLLMLGSGAVIAVLAPRVLDPIAVEVALRPGRVALWVPISLALWIGAAVLFTLTVVGVAVSVIIALAMPAVAALGYLATGLLLGDRMGRFYGRTLEPWQAILLGVGVMRLVRLIPFVGGTLHTLLLLWGLAAASVVGWDLARSWHRRRMPDDEQFAGEDLIEWNPQDASDRDPKPRRRRFKAPPTRRPPDHR